MSTALYRRYRPDTFADVIGQEHVTTPLMAALEKNRVNHAYLFSGPRGCGKTTSARILARCLNCEQGPTAMPCGTCDSCRELATGGPGSLDVIEIDAASHGGVDDARDLRERATFAPVRDRYKIFIIDEAHMVTSAGFNALLKIVEEPPEHIKFIFATTEPDKVIGTIRSRTHHYPFRLVPPEPLMAYLERLSESEGVPVAPGVLSLVVRAGGGSVRDSLSVLDQLIAGAGPDGLDYELAVSLLGYTHASLLDDVVDAMAAQDASVVFGAVDRVIQTGHDPRRFVEDLLERFRDLIIVKAMPDNAAQIIRGLPEDQLNRMRQQASQLGQAELSRSADVTNQALTEMTGATSPRLHLELLCARLLLPASDTTERGINARIDRIDRRLAYAGDTPAAGPSGTAGPPTAARYDGGAAPESNGSPSGHTFESPREQGAAQVREALRSARKQDTVDVRETATEAAPAAAAEPADAEPVAAVPAADESNAPQSLETPTAADEHVAAERAAAPALAGGAAAPPAAASPAPQASPDWGGNWGAVPEPEPTRPEPARGGPVAPDPARDERASTAHQEARPGPAARQGQRPDDGTRPAADARSSSSSSSGAPAASAPASPAAPTAAKLPSEPSSAAPPTGASSAGPPAAGSIEMFRRAWPEIMAALKEEKKFVWLTIQPHASLAGYDGRTLTVAFANPGPMNAFSGKAENVGLLQQCIHKVLGVKCEIVITAGGSAPAGGSGPKADRRPTPADAPAATRTGTTTPVNAPSGAEGRVAPPTDQATRIPAPVPRTAAAAAPVAAPAPATASAPTPSSRTSTAGPAAPAPAPREQPAPAAKPQAASAPAPEAARPSGEATSAAPAPAQALASRRANRAPQPPSAGQAPLRGGGRKAAAAPSTEDIPDYGPEPDDEGGYDWGADNVPVPDWELPAAGSAQPATATLAQSAPSAPSAPTAADNQAPMQRGSVAPASAAPLSPASPSSARAASPAAPRPGEQAVAPAPGRPFSAPEAFRTPTSAPAEAGPSAPAAPAAPVPAAGGSGQKRLSRYQQLLSQARESDGPDARTQQPAPPYGRPGAPAAAPAGGDAVDSKYVEDIPSDDDIAIEESGVVGRPAIERLLNGRLIEERNHDGSPVT